MMTVRSRVLRVARGWIGTPYRHQASLRGVGCDCLGLVRGVWREVYGVEPEQPEPYAPDWDASGTGEPMLEAAQRHCIPLDGADALPGDLVLFRWRAHLGIRHIGIMEEGGRFIHAYEGSAVISSVLVPVWQKRIAAHFAFPPIT